MADPYIVERSGIRFFELDELIIRFTKPSSPREVLTHTTTETRTATGPESKDVCIDTKHFDLFAQPWARYKVSLYEIVQRSSAWKVIGTGLLVIGGLALLATGVGALAGATLIVTGAGTLTAVGSCGLAVGAGGLVGGGAILKGEVVKDYTTGGLVQSYEKDVPLEPNEVLVGHSVEIGQPYPC